MVAVGSGDSRILHFFNAIETITAVAIQTRDGAGSCRPSLVVKTRPPIVSAYRCWSRRWRRIGSWIGRRIGSRIGSRSRCWIGGWVRCWTWRRIGRRSGGGVGRWSWSRLWTFGTSGTLFLSTFVFLHFSITFVTLALTLRGHIIDLIIHVVQHFFLVVNGSTPLKE